MLLCVFEYTAILFNLAYLVLAIRGNKYCWPVSIVGVILSFIVYIHPDVSLYSDALLQVFYVMLSVHGWMSWNKSETSGREIQIKVMGLSQHLIVLAAGLLGTLLMGAFWSHFNGSFPYWDAGTTAFAIITTYLVVQRFLENWLYWIMIDLVCMVLYFMKGLNGFSFLFLLYTVMAVWGYFQWRQKYRKQPDLLKTA